MTYARPFVSFISSVVRRSVAVLAIGALLVGGVVAPTTAHAAGKTFYVSSSDTTASDTNTGTSATSAWKTITKVNSALSAGTITAGDTVYFKRGDTFYGGLVMARSGSAGNPIVFTSTTSYSGGTGAKPVISGFTSITSGWTSVGTNLWEITAPTGVNNLSTMVINGVVAPLGRFPKETAVNGGYLAMTYDAATGANVTFTDSTGVLASQPNFAGADVVFRPNHWTQARGVVLTHTGNAITLTQKASSYGMANNIGFFIQNSPSILTQNGEWAYIAGTNKIRLYYAGTPPTVNIASVDKLVSLSTFDYLTFSNLSFEGAKSNAFDGNTAGFITIDANDITYAGQYAVYLNYGNDIAINRNTITNSQNNAILVNSPTLNNLNILNNTITNTGIRMGTIVPLSTTDTLNGINIRVASNALIQGNTVRFTGDNGIRFNGNNVTIRNNVVSDFTLQLDDGGGIYTYGGGNTPANPAVTQYTNRVIDQNIVYNGNGAPYGTASNGRQSSGIYLDNNSNHIDITNNTIFDVVTKGIPLNSPQHVKITGNTIFNTNKGSIGICRWMNDGTQSNGGQDPVGLTVTGNTLFNISDGQVVLSYCDFGIKEANPTNLAVAGTVKLNSPASTIDSRLQSMSTAVNFNNNIYRTIDQPSVNIEYQETTAGPYLNYPDYSFDLWKKHTGFDASSIMVPLKKYTINSTVATLFNSTLDTLTGITTSGTTSTLTLDTTSKVTGVGSAKVTVVTPPTSSNFNYKAYSVFAGLNTPISSTKKYLVRVTTVGTTENGMVKVSMYKKVAPYAYLSPSQYSAYGTGKMTHEFLFANPTSSGTSNGSVLIEILEASGNTYIDDIQVYEVDATVVDPNADVIFEYNDSTLPKIITLPIGNYYKPGDIGYTDPYSGTVTLQPYTSIVLMKQAGAPVVVVDTTVPVVSIVSPAAASSLSGSVTLSANATDNVAVSKVDFYQGTTLIGTDTTAPYTTLWDTTTAINGAYTLKAIATDSATNTATSATIAVTVDNTIVDTTAPIVSMSAPIAGATLSGSTTLSATASDNVAVTGVDFYQDTTLIGTSTTAPYTVTWNTTAVANGPYTLKAIARDVAGNSATSTTIAVTVTNTTVDTTAPTVTMTSPAGGSVLSGTVTLTADASDNVGVTKVNLYVGSTLMASDTTAPYTATWNTTASTNSTFGLKAIAYDAAGNTTTSPSVVVSVNNLVAPTTAITSPLSGVTVSGTVGFTATATGTGITSVAFYKDSDTTPFATATTSPYTVFFDSKTVANGTHTFKTVVTTTSGSATSASITLTINNVTTTVPSAPTAVSAVAGYTKARVSWSAPTTNGGAAITSYTVKSVPGNKTVSSATSPASVTGLTNGTAYTFTVQAVNSVGVGASATTNSITPVVNFTVGSQVVVSTTSSTLTVRKTASTNGTKVGSVTNGTIGTVTQTSTGWTKVQFPTMLGWVSNTYLFPNL